MDKLMEAIDKISQLERNELRLFLHYIGGMVETGLDNDNNIAKAIANGFINKAKELENEDR